MVDEHESHPLDAGVEIVYVCDPREHIPHDPIQSTLLFAVQAAAAVLVHPFGLLHHHVHGPAPLTIVGTHVAQVAVGVTYALNAILHDPLIQATLAFVQAVAVVLVHPSALLHHHVAL